MKHHRNQKSYKSDVRNQKTSQIFKCTLSLGKVLWISKARNSLNSETNDIFKKLLCSDGRMEENLPGSSEAKGRHVQQGCSH